MNPQKENTTPILPIKLVKDTIDSNDFEALAEWIKTQPKLSKDKLVKQFEERMANYLGVKYAVMVNSGSSANLLMLHALTCTQKLKNKKIVLPAVSWATDLAPVMQLGLDPILCDVNMSDYSVDLTNLEYIFETEHPAALVLVSVLGLVPDMDRIIELCKKYEVTLLLDNCEGLGSKYKTSHLEHYAVMSTTSLYIGHIISTGEGGVVVTNDYDLYNVLLMTRAHGWDRDLDENAQYKIRQNNNITDFEALYTFYLPGFNFRPTEIQGFLGLRQLDKLTHYIEQRNYNYEYYQTMLCDNKNIILPDMDHRKYVSNLGFPIIVPNTNREDLAKELQNNNIECRPLISGNLAKHPVWKFNYPDKKTDYLVNADIIHNHGMYLPNNPHMNNEELNRVINVIENYFDNQ